MAFCFNLGLIFCCPCLQYALCVLMPTPHANDANDDPILCSTTHFLPTMSNIPTIWSLMVLTQGAISQTDPKICANIFHYLRQVSKWEDGEW